MAEQDNQIELMRETLVAKRDDLRRKLEDVEKALEGLEIATKLTRASRSSGSSGRRKESALSRIREIVCDASGVFTIHEIHETYQERFPDEPVKQKTISTSLSKLAENEPDLIVVEQEGKGRRAAQYRRATHFNTRPTTSLTDPPDVNSETFEEVEAF